MKKLSALLVVVFMSTLMFAKNAADDGPASPAWGSVVGLCDAVGGPGASCAYQPTCAIVMNQTPSDSVNVVFAYGNNGTRTMNDVPYITERTNGRPFWVIVNASECMADSGQQNK